MHVSGGNTRVEKDVPSIVIRPVAGGGGVAYFGNFQGYVFLGRNSPQFSKLMGNQPVLVAIVTSEALSEG